MNATLDKEPAVAKAMKLLARVMDPACPEAEAETSAVFFARQCRSKAILLPDIIKSLAIVPDIGSYRDTRPAACNVEFTFGKYGGWAVGDVAMRDPDYLVWAIENLTKKPELINAMKIAAAHYGLEVAV